MEIVVGTYEEFVLGYRFIQTGKKYQLSQTFANHAHNGSVRCLSCSGKLVASGGVDETIRLFNLKTRVEVGTLQQHNGTINNLTFCEGFHLASCSDDGTICIWNAHSWQCLKTLRGHKAAVNSVSIHPSGKLAFSVSKDKSLRTWNLVKGRSAYVTNIKDVAEIVVCSPDGQHFAVVVKTKVDIYKLDAAGVIHSIDFGKHVLCICFLQDVVLAVGGEKEELEIHNIRNKALIQVFNTHSKRLKGLCSVDLSAILRSSRCLVTASSDGYIKVWRFNSDKLDESPELCSEVNTKCRITCLAVSTIQGDEGESEMQETIHEGSLRKKMKKYEGDIDERIEEENKITHFKRKKKNKI